MAEPIKTENYWIRVVVSDMYFNNVKLFYTQSLSYI